MEVEKLHVKKELVVGEGDHQMLVLADDDALRMWFGPMTSKGHRMFTVQSTPGFVWFGLAQDDYGDDVQRAAFDLCFCLDEANKPWVQFVDDQNQVHMLSVKDMQEAVENFVNNKKEV